MNIILGIFSNPEFWTIRVKTDSLMYPFYSEEEWDNHPCRKMYMMHTVRYACERAGRIHFVLDYYKYSYEYKSRTMEEFELVTDTPEFLEKTTFWRGDVEIPTEQIIKESNRQLNLQSN